MPSGLLYFKNVVVNGALSIQDGGTAPATGITTTGWTVAKLAAANFSLLAVNTKRASGTFSTTDALTTPAFSAASCWRSELPYLGSFANANWTIDFRLRAVSAALSQAGRVKVRIWKFTNADGTGATQLTSAALTGTTTSSLTTTGSGASTVTWTSPGVQTFTNEYLWVQCEWEIISVSGSNSSDAVFNIESSGRISNPTFTGVPVYSQKHFRFRTDTGAVDATPTWAKAEDTSILAADYLNINYRLRFSLENSGTASLGQTYTLRYSRNGGAYTPITTSSSVVQAVDAGSDPDGAIIVTQRLTSSLGSWQSAGPYSETGTTSSVTQPFNNNFSEFEFGIKIVTADVVNNDTIDFQLFPNTTGAITQTVTPRITVGLIRPLTATNFVSSNILNRVPVIGRGPVGVTASRYTDPDTLNRVPVVRSIYALLQNKYTSPDIFGTPVVAQAAVFDPVAETRVTEDSTYYRITEDGVNARRVERDLSLQSVVVPWFANTSIIRPPTVAPVVTQALRGLIYCLPCTDPTWAEIQSHTTVVAQAGFSLAYVGNDIGAQSDGVGTDYISYLYPASQPPQNWTIEALIYLNAVPSSGSVDISGFADGSGSSFIVYDRSLYVTPTAFSVFQNGSDGLKVATAGTPAVGRFHIIATQTGTSLRLYVNGVGGTAVTTTTGGYNLYGVGPYFRLGSCFSGDTAINGTVLLVNFANVAWNATEIAARVADPYGFLAWPSDSFGRGNVSIATGSAAALLPTRYLDSDAFGTDVVGRGPVSIVPNRYSDADSFGTDTINCGPVGLVPSRYLDPDSFTTGDVVGRGPRGLVPLIYSDPDGFGTDVVTRGPRGLVPARYSDPDAFGLDSITRGPVGLIPARYTDPDNFTTGDVVGRGPRNLIQAIYLDPDNFGTDVVTRGPRGLTPTRYTDPDAYGIDSITRGTVNLLQAKYSDPDAIGPAIVRAFRTVLHSLYSDPDSFGTDVITRGAVNLLQNRYTDPDTFGTDIVSQGARIVAPNKYNDPDSFFTTLVHATRTLSQARFVDPDSFNTTVVRVFNTLTETRYIDPDNIGTHLVRSLRELIQTRYSDPDTFGTDVITRGPRNLIQTRYLDPDNFGVPFITTISGDKFVFPARYPDPDLFGAASLHTLRGVTHTRYLDPDVIGSPVVQKYNRLLPPIYTDIDSFGLDHVNVGPVGILPSRYLDPDIFRNTIVGRGTKFILPPRLIDPDFFGIDSIAVGAAKLLPQAYLDPDLFGIDHVSAGSIDIFHARYIDSDIYYNQILRSLNTVRPNRIIDPDQFWNAIIKYNQFIFPHLFQNQLQVYRHLIYRAILQLTARFVLAGFDFDYILQAVKNFYVSVVTDSEELSYTRPTDKWNYTAIPAQSMYLNVAPRKMAGSMPPIGPLPDIGVNQRQTIALDFGNFLPPGVTLTGVPTITMLIGQGQDDLAQTRLVAGPVIGVANRPMGGTGINNTAIIFTLAGCKAGVEYIIEAYCTRTDTDIAEASTRILCVEPS